MKNRIIKGVLAILAIVALILLVAEKADDATWEVFWAIKGIAAFVLAVCFHFIGKLCPDA